MAAVRHLGFLKFENFNFRHVRRPKFIVRHRANKDRWNRCGDMADFRFFKMAAVRHLGFVLRVLGPPTKRTWWSLLLCKIWLQSAQ